MLLYVVPGKGLAGVSTKISGGEWTLAAGDEQEAEEWEDDLRRAVGWAEAVKQNRRAQMVRRESRSFDQ